MFSLSRCVGFVLCLSICSLVPGLTQAQSKKEVVFEKTVTANDGWPIKLTYYKHEGKKDSAVVILLHSSQGDKRVWTAGFADQLWKEGFAVVAVDLRKFGESKIESVSGASSDVGDLRPDDYTRMVTQDLAAVKQFIFEEHQQQNLNMRKIGIVAAEMSTPIALNFALLDWNKKPYDDAPTFALRTPRGQDIRSLVLISPMSSLPGMNTVSAINGLRDEYKNISFLFCVGEKDEQDRGETNRLFKRIKGRARNTDERIYLQKYPYQLRGMALIGKNIKIEDHIVIFLKKSLLELDDEWQDRRSRLQR